MHMKYLDVYVILLEEIKMDTDLKITSSKKKTEYFERIFNMINSYETLKDFYLNNEDELIDCTEIFLDWKFVSNDIVQSMRNDTKFRSIFERLYYDYCKNEK